SIVPTLNTPYRSRASFDNYEANVTYLVTPAVSLGAAYTYTAAPDAKYQQFNVGAQYFLSKRTTLYMVGIYQHASGLDSYGRQAVAQINQTTPSSAASQLLVRLGLLVKF
ncbi:MAG: porin, partial [Burkholderia sp.]